MIGTITATRLNVRAEPDRNGAKLGELSKGTVVTIHGQHKGWFEIQYGDSSAFIFSDYVTLHEHTPHQSGVTTANLLNVRSGPQADTSVIGQLPENTEVVIESTFGDWYEILFNDRKGYISSRYVRKLANGDTSPAITIDRNEREEGETPSPGTVAASTIGNNTLLPAAQLSVTGTDEERKVATTWNSLGGLLTRLSDELDIDVACAVAVLCVESSGKGFDANNQNRMIIRFENHKFWKYWGKTDPDHFRLHFTYNSNKAWTGHKWRKTPSDDWQTFHGIQQAEWDVLEFARTIDNNAALMSISMGAPQIMGFHYETIGYHSVQEMFDAFAAGIEAQIKGLFDFMTKPMIVSLQRRDFTAFAAGYNGSGQKESYGRWINRHYQAFKRIS